MMTQGPWLANPCSLELCPHPTPGLEAIPVGTAGIQEERDGALGPQLPGPQACLPDMVLRLPPGRQDPAPCDPELSPSSPAEA